METVPNVRRSVAVLSLRNFGFCRQLYVVGFKVDRMSVEQALLRIRSVFPC